MRNRTAHALAAALLAAAVLALYAGTLRNPLVFDDAALTEEFLVAYGASDFHLDLRRFAYATFGWTWRLLGPDFVWLRMGNVLMHAASAVALYAFAWRLLRALLPGEAPARLRTAALGGAALFALHPMAVYGVAYLMQRSILMATLFGLVSLILFLEGLLRRRQGWFYASAAAYFVAVFSKEHCVMLPAVAAAIAVLVRGASWRLARELAAPAALFAGIAVFVVLKQRGLLGATYEPFAQAAIAQLSESQAAPAPGSVAPAAGEGAALFAASVVNQGWLFFRYLLLWVIPWPDWMSIDLRVAFPGGWLAWPQTAGFVAWLAWPAAALFLLRQGHRAGLAGLAMLAPWLLGLTEFSAVRLQEPFVLYRSYLWMCLLALLPAAALSCVAVRRAALLAAVAGALLAAASVERLGTFSSELAVWEDAVRKVTDERAPLAERPLRHRGIAHFRAGSYEAAQRDFDEVVRRNARDPENWLARGTLHMRTARSAEALADFDRALQLAPGHAEVLGRRCVVLMRVKRLDEAGRDCARALRLAPYVAANHVSQGMVHALRGRADEAEKAYARALELAPSSADARYQYGVLLAGTGRSDAALAHLRAACAAKLEAACRRLR